jgi:hypothetical protein
LPELPSRLHEGVAALRWRGFILRIEESFYAA